MRMFRPRNVCYKQSSYRASTTSKSSKLQFLVISVHHCDSNIQIWVNHCASYISSPNLMSAAAEQWNHSPVCVQKNETEKEWEREGGRMVSRYSSNYAKAHWAAWKIKDKGHRACTLRDITRALSCTLFNYWNKKHLRYFKEPLIMQFEKKHPCEDKTGGKARKHLLICWVV